MSNANYLCIRKEYHKRPLTIFAERMFVVGMKCDVKQRPDALREFSLSLTNHCYRFTPRRRLIRPATLLFNTDLSPSFYIA